MEENEITIKILLTKSVPLTTDFYMDIINGLNDKYIPCNQICLNGKIIFDNTQGFIKEDTTSQEIENKEN